MSNGTKGYNGWANYETWCVHLWLANDEGSYRYWREEAERHQAAAPNHPNIRWGIFTIQEAARHTLGEAMEQAFETFHPFRGEHLAKPMEPDVYCDLLDAALSEVRWSEIAEAFLEGLEPEDEPDPEGEQGDGDESEQEVSEEPKQEEARGPSGPRFELGRVVATPGAVEALTPEEIAKAISRHLRGDWGEVGPEDWQENETSLREGFRLLSAYRSQEGEKFWVITEADRSATTVLLPDEY